MQHLEKYDMHEMQDDTKKCGMKDKQNKIRERQQNNIIPFSYGKVQVEPKVNLIKQQLEKL